MRGIAPLLHKRVFLNLCKRKSIQSIEHLEYRQMASANTAKQLFDYLLILDFEATCTEGEPRIKPQVSVCVRIIIAILAGDYRISMYCIEHTNIECTFNISPICASN